MPTHDDLRAMRLRVRRLEDALSRALAGDTEAARAIAEGAPAPKRARARRGKRLISLDPTAESLLSRADNASAYVSALVVDAHQRALRALGHLRSAGWDTPELLGACDALNGVWMGDLYLEGDIAATVWMELADAQRLNGTADQHGCAPAVWDARIHQLAERRELARDLVTVVTEWWRGNGALDVAIRRST